MDDINWSHSRIIKCYEILTDFRFKLIVVGGMELKTFRVPGVLQRFAVSYFVVAMLHLISAKPTLEEYRISVSL